ncbi:M15 family metallopeptidase [Micromonospora sp. B11E3]|uniref:M15 family metallopeptidase n=1 Tax=Micromonospora sp. B11E3 TaxID=3153562 RepID=UPI00325F5D87
MGRRRRPGRPGWWAALAVAAAVPLAACPAPRGPAPAPPPTPAEPRAPAGFVVLSDVDPTIVSDIRYATAHNFVGRPIAGYAEPLCVLTRPAAEALSRVQRAARAAGHRLKVYDCYRPQRAVADFVAWAGQPDEQRMKAEFYPRVAKARLFDDGYVGAPTAHSRGSTLDLTLVPDPPPPQRPYVPGEPLVACTAPPGERFGDNGVDMGTGFDCFDPLAHTADPRVTGAARANRELLRRLMTDGGFTNYPREWWHYRYDAEPYPDTYFDFPVARSAL